MPLHVVLVEPEIHYNTGNVARTCAATGSHLHLVRPLGYRLEDRYLRRAGLDYWNRLVLHVHGSVAEVLAGVPRSRVWLVTPHGPVGYHEVRYEADDYLLFGRESTGLAPDLLAAYPDRMVRVPMRPEVRSLNLSNTVALVVYEALRQLGHPAMV